MSPLDDFDRKILDCLQKDGRLTNGELSEQVGLSPSQCSRRRSQLEADGTILGYGARLDPEKIGIGIACMISINLASHNEDSAIKLKALLQRLPNVTEAHSVTGEVDYVVRVVTGDLRELSDFINGVLLPHEAVQNVRTSIVLDTVKESGTLPIREISRP